jgi:hypothetical protein
VIVTILPRSGSDRLRRKLSIGSGTPPEVNISRTSWQLDQPIENIKYIVNQTRRLLWNRRVFLGLRNRGFVDLVPYIF